MGMWQLSAISNILNRPLVSVCPRYGNYNVRNDINRVFYPRDMSSKEVPIYIMWTNTSGANTPENRFVLNHFVLLMPLAEPKKDHSESLLDLSISFDETGSDIFEDETTIQDIILDLFDNHEPENNQKSGDIYTASECSTSSATEADREKMPERATGPNLDGKRTSISADDSKDSTSSATELADKHIPESFVIDMAPPEPKGEMTQMPPQTSESRSVTEMVSPSNSQNFVLDEAYTGVKELIVNMPVKTSETRSVTEMVNSPSFKNIELHEATLEENVENLKQTSDGSSVTVMGNTSTFENSDNDVTPEEKVQMIKMPVKTSESRHRVGDFLYVRCGNENFPCLIVQTPSDMQSLPDVGLWVQFLRKVRGSLWALQEKVFFLEYSQILSKLPTPTIQLTGTHVFYNLKL